MFQDQSGTASVLSGFPVLDPQKRNEAYRTLIGSLSTTRRSSIYDNCQEVLIIVFRLQPQALVGTHDYKTVGLKVVLIITTT